MLITVDPHTFWPSYAYKFCTAYLNEYSVISSSVCATPDSTAYVRMFIKIVLHSVRQWEMWDRRKADRYDVGLAVCVRFGMNYLHLLSFLHWERMDLCVNVLFMLCQTKHLAPITMLVLPDWVFWLVPLLRGQVPTDLQQRLRWVRPHAHTHREF